eukprot:6674614-Prymnesium_polylepis.1
MAARESMAARQSMAAGGAAAAARGAMARRVGPRCAADLRALHALLLALALAVTQRLQLGAAPLGEIAEEAKL